MERDNMKCRKCKREVVDAPYCCQCGAKQSVAGGNRKPKSRGNGHGSVYKRGNTWQAEIMLGWKIDPETGNKKKDVRTKGGFPRKSDALDYIPVLKLQKQEESKKIISTLRDHWQGYSNGQMTKLSANKQLTYRIAFSRLKSLENKPIDVITINDLQRQVDEQTESYYPARDMKVLLSHLYKRGMAQQEVTVNLSKFIVLPELEEKEPVPFTEAELKKLWADYGEGHKLTGYILLMTYSGMMPGELFKAKKEMVDWQNQRIIGCGLKTKKRKETPIVVANLVLPVLKDLCESTKGEYLLDMNRNDFYDAFHETLTRCKIDDRTPYVCRHTTATALSLGNIAPDIIREVMRHNNFSTTERYIHKEIDTAPMLDAVNKMPNCKE
ncbi:tyrosine-type recombinase/integrase [Ruminococcaceae bacterium OttesenSCG-928-I18]|nr:tyrosine-type recombinase/integrase [Ruminococcaceae bacterium OttesenSCG-928-I18]